MQTQLVTGSTGDIAIGGYNLYMVRVAGTAALAGAVQVKRGATVLETLAAATAVGIERDYGGAAFDSANPLQINLANAADTILVLRS